MLDYEFLLNLATVSVLVIALSLACFFDLRTRRIPNWLSAGTLALGVFWNLLAPEGAGLFAAANAGTPGLWETSLSTIGVLVCLFFLYSVRVMGAGDAKLIAAVSTFSGGVAAVGLVLAIFAVGGVAALMRMRNPGRRVAVLRNLRLISLGALNPGVGPKFDPKADTADHLPYAFAIAGGTVVFALYTYFDLGPG